MNVKKKKTEECFVGVPQMQQTCITILGVTVTVSAVNRFLWDGVAKPVLDSKFYLYS